MIEIDLDGEDLACLGMRLASADEWRFPRDPDAFLRAYAANSRREQRQRVAKALAVVRAAKRAGLSVRTATIEGVELQFGERDPPKQATEEAPPSRSLFKARLVPKERVVL